MNQVTYTNSQKQSIPAAIITEQPAADPEDVTEEIREALANIGKDDPTLTLVLPAVEFGEKYTPEELQKMRQRMAEVDLDIPGVTRLAYFFWRAAISQSVATRKEKGRAAR